MTYQPHQSEDLTLKCLPDGMPFDKDGNQRKRYVRLEHDGAWCICTPGDAADMIGDDASEYTASDVMLSEPEFNALPEFGGW